MRRLRHVVTHAVAAFVVAAPLIAAMGCSATAAPSGARAASVPKAPRVGDPIARAFLEGRRHGWKGRHDEAIQAYAKVIEAGHLLAGHALLRTAEQARRRGDERTANEALDRLLRDHPGSVWTARASVDRAESLADRAPGRALELANRAISAGDADLTRRARFLRASILDDRGQHGEAYRDVLRLAGGKDDLAERARALRSRLEELGPRALGTTAGRLALDSARARLKEGDVKGATTRLAPALHGSGSQVAEAHLLEAKLGRYRGDAAEIRQRYDRAVAKSRGTRLAGEALYERARWLWNRDEDRDAAVSFRALLDEHPSHSRAGDARYALGRIAEASGRHEDASRWYTELTRRNPDHGQADEAAWRAGFVSYRAGRPAAAAEAFATVASADGRYWHARTLELAGDATAAQKVRRALLREEPTSFPAWWLDDSGEALFSSRPAAPGPAMPPALDGEAALHMRRALLLLDLALGADAVPELRSVQRAAGPSRFLLETLHRAEAYPDEIRMAREVARRGQAVPRNRYPRVYADAFEAAGRESGLDPLLLMALSWRESLFQADVRSPAGAHGVMQLMPTTARSLAGREMSRDELSNPHDNIRLGARYLRRVLDRYDGRLILALAAYNGGPRNVDKWLQRAGDARGDEFVERISFRETRDYVKGVLRNYRWYLRLYGRKIPAALRLF